MTPLQAALDGPIEWLSRFWRDAAGKQLSGFTLVGASALGLTLSVRKRVRLLRRTSLSRALQARTLAIIFDGLRAR